MEIGACESQSLRFVLCVLRLNVIERQTKTMQVDVKTFLEGCQPKMTPENFASLAKLVEYFTQFYSMCHPEAPKSMPLHLFYGLWTDGGLRDVWHRLEGHKPKEALLQGRLVRVNKMWTSFPRRKTKVKVSNKAVDISYPAPSKTKTYVMAETDGRTEVIPLHHLSRLIYATRETAVPGDTENSKEDGDNTMVVSG